MREMQTDQPTVEESEEIVRGGFWDKARLSAGKVPFVEDAVAAYYCAMDSATPAYVRGVLLGALAYFVVPTDMIPDFIAAFGFTDDATVLAAALSAVGGALRDRHRDSARAWLGKAPLRYDD